MSLTTVLYYTIKILYSKFLERCLLYGYEYVDKTKLKDFFLIFIKDTLAYQSNTLVFCVILSLFSRILQYAPQDP